MTRSDRRRTAKAGSGPPIDTATLRARIDRVPVPGAPAALLGRARRLLGIYLDTAAGLGVGYRAIVEDLASGRAALRIGLSELERQTAAPDSPMRTAACATGCAFCCLIDDGGSGGPITRTEAEALQAALAGPAIRPDARTWHPRACAALDPATRTCRAYDARPMICRSYVSPDAAACARNAEGEAVPGPGVAGAHPLYLAVLALCRIALAGVAEVRTWSLARTTAAVMAGRDIGEAIQPPKALRDELRGIGKALASPGERRRRG